MNTLPVNPAAFAYQDLTGADQYGGETAIIVTGRENRGHAIFKALREKGCRDYAYLLVTEAPETCGPGRKLDREFYQCDAAGVSQAPLWEPREVLGKRIALLLVTIVFVATIQWLGLTLGLLLGMLAALWLVGVRRPAVLVGISVVVAASAYLLFIAALDSSFPHGPIEIGVDKVLGR